MAKENSLGSLIRQVRQQNGWTLREMSAKVGIPLSTLAKVESDKLSMTYEKLQQFTTGLGMSMAEFLSQADRPLSEPVAQVVTARKSVTNADNTIDISTPNY